jgi:hypothetical protein
VSAAAPPGTAADTARAFVLALGQAPAVAAASNNVEEVGAEM